VTQAHRHKVGKEKAHKNSVPSFTLVELMIVMGVIIILVGMLFPVILGMKERMRERQARVEVHNIMLALKSYRMEFGQWPNQTQAATDTTYFADNYQVILPLVGQNARGKVYLTLQASNQTDSAANFVDPWGVPYVICLNEDMSTNCLIDVVDVMYTNNYARPPTVYRYSATNYSVANMDVAVASFANKVSASVYKNSSGNCTNLFGVETWSEAR